MKRPEEIKAYLYNKNNGNRGCFEVPLWLSRTIIEEIFKSDAFRPVVDEAFLQLKKIYEKYRAQLSKCVRRVAQSYNPVYLPLGPAYFCLETSGANYIRFKNDAGVPLVEDPCPELLDSVLKVSYNYGLRDAFVTDYRPEVSSRNMVFSPAPTAPKGHGTVGRDGIRAEELAEMIYGRNFYSSMIDMEAPPSQGCILDSVSNAHGIRYVYVRCLGLQGDLGVERIASIFYDELCPTLDKLEAFCSDCLDAKLELENMPLFRDIETH